MDDLTIGGVAEKVVEKRFRKREGDVERQRRLISIHYSHDPDEVRELCDEVTRFQGDCHYCPFLRKIIYSDGGTAMHAYMTLQREATERAVEARGGDVSAAVEWLETHGTDWRNFWRRTHVYTPSEETREVRVA